LRGFSRRVISGGVAGAFGDFAMRAITGRERLPDRRPAVTRDIAVSGLRYRVTSGYYPDGRVAEVFIDGVKVGSAADIAARDSAIAASLAIQFGADPDTIRRALCRDACGRALGPLAAALDVIIQEEGMRGWWLNT
jgi:hypothetical protein